MPYMVFTDANTISQFLGGYLQVLFPEQGGSLSVYSQFLGGYLATIRERALTLQAISQFLGGYLAAYLCHSTGKHYNSQFLGGYLHGSLYRTTLRTILALNSLADTCGVNVTMEHGVSVGSQFLGGYLAVHEEVWFER